jgi:hypothetical protein
MFKRAIAVLMVCLLIGSCGKSVVIDGNEYNTTGIIEMLTKTGDYNGKIKYEPCWGNIVLGAILCETVIVPIYFFGFSMFNPVGLLEEK